MFLHGREQWPRHREWESGRNGLYQAVLTHGGTHEWARRMGVKWVKRSGGLPRYWTEERVREQLAGFLAGRNCWPIGPEFQAAGHGRLLRAARRTGGVQRWAREFGLDPDPPSLRRPTTRSDADAARAPARGAKRSRHWTDERLEAAISPLVRELGRWPTKGEFRRAGLGGALSAVYDHGGRARWQKRLGVARRRFAGPIPSRRRWTQERIEFELREFCSARVGWPAYGEFKANGASGLYSAVARYGGVELWRERLGL